MSPLKSDHLTAIKATIPPGDPSSKERMEWCKAAMVAVADTCFEHAKAYAERHKTGANRDALTFDAIDGICAGRDHAVNHLLKKANADA